MRSRVWMYGLNWCPGAARSGIGLIVGEPLGGDLHRLRVDLVVSEREDEVLSVTDREERRMDGSREMSPTGEPIVTKATTLNSRWWATSAAWIPPCE